MIFAREISDPLIGLIKETDRHLDNVMARRPNTGNLGVFVVFLSDDPGMEGKLRELLAWEHLKRVVLCTHPAAGPQRYNVSPEADVTAVIYQNHNTVMATFAFRRGELDDDWARDIFLTMNRIVP